MSKYNFFANVCIIEEPLPRQISVGEKDEGSMCAHRPVCVGTARQPRGPRLQHVQVSGAGACDCGDGIWQILAGWGKNLGEHAIWKKNYLFLEQDLCNE